MAVLVKSVNGYTPFTLILASISMQAFGIDRAIQLPSPSAVNSIENQNRFGHFAAHILNTALQPQDLAALTQEYGFSGCLPQGPHTPDYFDNLANAGVICEKKMKEKEEISGKSLNRPWSNANSSILMKSMQKRLGTRVLYSFSNNNETLNNFINGYFDVNFSLKDGGIIDEKKPTYSLRVVRTPYRSDNQVETEKANDPHFEGEELEMKDVKEIVEDWDGDSVDSEIVENNEEITIQNVVHRELGLTVKPFDTVKMRVSRKGDSWGFNSLAFRVEEGAGLVFVECSLEAYGFGLKIPMQNKTFEVVANDIKKKPVIKYSIFGDSSQTHIQYNLENQAISGGISLAI